MLSKRKRNAEDATPLSLHKKINSAQSSSAETTDVAAVDHLSMLPKDVLLDIWKFLLPIDWVRLRRVSKCFNDLSFTPSLWERHLQLLKEKFKEPIYEWKKPFTARDHILALLRSEFNLCGVCGAGRSRETLIKPVWGILYCKACRLKYFCCLAAAKRELLLTSDDLKGLPYDVVPGRINAQVFVSWQLREIAVKKFGGEDGLKKALETNPQRGVVQEELVEFE